MFEKIQYLIDKNTFKLKPKNTLTKITESFMVSVMFPSCSESFCMRDLKEVELNIKQMESEIRINNNDGGEILIAIEKPEDWYRYLNKNLSHFIGLITTVFIAKGKEDFLWIQQSNCKKIWILNVVWENSNWKGLLVECLRPIDLNRIFWEIMPGERGEKRNKELAANELFNFLKDKKGLGLPEDFFKRLDSSISREQKRFLTIKVHPDELWFLLFPIDYFCKYRYSGFSLYKEVEWILTPEKSFIQNFLERSLLQEELQNVEEFLKHSIIVLNTYPKEQTWKKDNRWEKGTKLVTEILSLFQNVIINDNNLSLRWYLNPTEDKIFEELFNRDTKYFFANFHLENNKWRISKCKMKSRKDISTVDIELKNHILKRGSLSHNRLMRIFHCHSIIIPDSTVIETPSITQLLLDAGALRVEGSIMEENYLDHLCSLLNICCNPKGLQQILLWKCYEKNINYSELMENVNKFLESYNLKTIVYKN